MSRDRLPDEFLSPVGTTVIQRRSEARSAQVGPETREADTAKRPSRREGWPHVEGYEVLAELGRGNMGVVYKARQLSLNRVVALKMVRSGEHASDLELQRFLDEARLVALLQHPNIIQIHDIGIQDGLPYFSMEYVPGGTLADQMSGRPIPAVRAASLVSTLARAIHAAHQAGVVHRDLKPANILIADGRWPLASGSDKSAIGHLQSALKITDFGLAKQLQGGSGQTQSGVVMGTPSYMAPEQAEGKSHLVGPTADVYALGAILYEMLTGRPPYNAESPAETVLQIFHADPVPPSRLQPRVPRDLETICLVCLRKEPRRRYPTADALADDLARFLAGETITARRASVFEQSWKWARRRPALATLATCAATALLALAGLGAWHQVDLRARLAQARADEREATARAEAERRDRERTEYEARGKVLLRDAEAALARHDWRNAQLLLTEAKAELGDLPELGDLRQQAEDLLRQAERRQSDRDRLARFQELRHDALFHATLFTGGDLQASLGRTQAAARQALALYGLTGEGGSLVVESPYLQEAEQAAIRAGCYELLLVLAETTAQPLPGQADDERRRQAAAALRILDQAARFGPPTRAYHRRRAHALELADDPAGANQERRRAEAVEPAGALDHFLVGTEEYRQQDWKKATMSFEAALGLRPDHFWAQYYLALCRLKTGRPDLAVASFTACLSQRGDFPWLYLLRGSAQTERKRHDDAAEDFARAAALPLDDDARYALQVNRGVLRLQQGRFAEAIADLGAAVQLRPALYQGHVNLAQAYIGQRKWPEALQHLDEAIRREPTLAALYRNRAQVHLQRPDLDAALADLDRAVSCRREGEGAARADDHLERARVFLRRKQYVAAADACDTALALQPQRVTAHRLRAEALLEAGRYAEARQSLDECLRHGPATADVYRARAAVLARMNELAAALNDYTRALDLEPEPATFAARGWTYLVMDAPRLARADFEEAIRRDADRADAYAGRGLARVQLGDVATGVRDAEEALRRGPETPRLLYSAARVFTQAQAWLDADRAARPGRAPATDIYQARAVALLGRALELVPEAERAEFWKSCVRADRALAPLRRVPAFDRLALRYAGPAR